MSNNKHDLKKIFNDNQMEVAYDLQQIAFLDGFLAGLGIMSLPVILLVIRLACY